MHAGQRRQATTICVVWLVPWRSWQTPAYLHSPSARSTGPLTVWGSSAVQHLTSASALALSRACRQPSHLHLGTVPGAVLMAGPRLIVNGNCCDTILLASYSCPTLASFTDVVCRYYMLLRLAQSRLLSALSGNHPQSLSVTDDSAECQQCAPQDQHLVACWLAQQNLQTVNGCAQISTSMWRS